jgi:lipoprotein-anchoring transpeptidase ErfK/SrfK
MMSRGKHNTGSNGGKKRWPRRAAAAFGLLLLLSGGAAYAAYRYEVSNANRILPGVTIAGVDVGGMTSAQASDAVEASISPSLDRTLTIRIGDDPRVRSFSDLGVAARVERAVDRAIGISDRLPWFSRAYHRLADNPVETSIDVTYRYQRSSVRSLLAQASEQVYRPPQNAAIELEHGTIVFQRALKGSKLNRKAGLQSVMSALRSWREHVSIPLEPILPKISAETLGKTITIDLSRNRLRLYEGFDVAATYDVGTAMTGYSTPTGMWKVTDKRRNPTWYNPAPDTWGAGLPLVIPGGPNNPLGTRALYLDAPGIRIHGTPDTSSVGGYVSHGCIRMRMWEVEELFPRVAEGTPVLIYGAPPWGIVDDPGTPGT